VIAHNTPPPLARAVVRALPIRPGQSILEAHVGTGAFPCALAAVYPDHRLRVEVGDLNPENPGLRLGPEVTQRFASWRAYPGVDFLASSPWRPPDLVIGNPPWGDGETKDEAEPHVRRALEVVRPGGSVVYVLQASFAFGIKRYANIWRPGSGIPRPFHVWNIVGRPSFNVTGSGKPAGKGGTTNKYEYSVIWWNTAVPDPRTTMDWMIDPETFGTRKRAWSGA
jgi:predicted RNA methylase